MPPKITKNIKLGEYLKTVKVRPVLQVVSRDFGIAMDNRFLSIHGGIGNIISGRGHSTRMSGKYTAGQHIILCSFKGFGGWWLENDIIDALVELHSSGYWESNSDSLSRKVKKNRKLDIADIKNIKLRVTSRWW